MSRPTGNFVSEWFGHRVFPIVVETEHSREDQEAGRCPFLTDAVGEIRECIKRPTSRGVCTINSASNGVRQDWLVCPYRALNPVLISIATRRLFDLDEDAELTILPAVKLARRTTQREVSERLDRNELVFTYFDAKLGGELSIPATDRSPEFSFDVTICQLRKGTDGPQIGRFGILEIQTMDFHGSYRAAVRNLSEAIRLHGDRFGQTLQEYPHWLSEGVQGPNISNVFKRTFYQMMFKFQLGQHSRCAGCVLAIPKSVWDSWQRHLGSPELMAEMDGTFSLRVPGSPKPKSVPAWIYVFDTDLDDTVTPSPIVLSKMIATDVAAMAHWALEIAPTAAVENIDSAGGLLTALARRLKPIWPELARTVEG